MGEHREHGTGCETKAPSTSNETMNHDQERINKCIKRLLSLEEVVQLKAWTRSSKRVLIAKIMIHK